MKYLSQFILYKILGWDIVGSFPEHLKKYVIIVAPHTSWADFPICILASSIKKIDVQFIAKASLFKRPFGWFFKFMGGMPVDRSSCQNSVAFIVSKFQEKENFIFSLSPEGTRKKVSKWKTGFYYIAKEANVPLVKVALDYGKKEIRIDKPYVITDSKENDFKHFHGYFEGTYGRHRELS